MAATLSAFLEDLKSPSGGKMMHPVREVESVNIIMKSIGLKESLIDFDIKTFLRKHKEITTEDGFMEVFHRKRRASTVRRYVLSLKSFVTYLLCNSDDHELSVLAHKALANMKNC